MVCQTCAEGHHPWNQANEQPEYQEHQDNFEEAFVVKQILQHLATKHGINFQEVAFKEEKRCPSCHMTLKDIAHVGKFDVLIVMQHLKMTSLISSAEFKVDNLSTLERHHILHIKDSFKEKIEEKNEYLKNLLKSKILRKRPLLEMKLKH